MKAYKIEKDGATDIIAAEGIISALLHYCEQSSLRFEEYFTDEDTITEIPVESWSEISITNNDYDKEDPDDKEVFTLEEMMADLMQPTIISSSEY